ILDLHMPSVSGLELLERFNAERNEDDFLPILVLTGDPRPEARLNALLLGARDFVMKPFDPVEVLFRLGNLLQTRHLVRRLRAVGRAVHH
ncbi:MAG TPA: response regulator, partial [Armatimonadota bacterium]|nr:response regulator [Armatimonadota bacterium]